MVSIDLHEKVREWGVGGRTNQKFKEEIQALQDYLDDKSTPEQAAVAFTRHVSNDPSEHPKTFYICFLLALAALESVAGDMPDTHDRLIVLLKATKGLPPVIRNGKQAVDEKGRRFRDDLPGFAKELHKMSGYLVRYVCNEGLSTNLGNHIKVLNVSSFIVKVLRQDLVRDEPLAELLEHGPVFLLKQALENSQSRKSPDDRLSSAQNTLVTAAARYILDACKYTYESDHESFGKKPLVKGEADSPRNNDWLLKEARDKGPISRWQFWINRFSEMYYRDDLDKSTRMLATQASQRMRTFEAYGPKVPLSGPF